MARNEKNQQGKTKNGLQYYIFPKKEFGEKAAAIVVKRGSNHLFWKGENGEEINFPQGTAHFIEHKLFQQEWGTPLRNLLRTVPLPMPSPMGIRRFIISPVGRSLWKI